MLLTVRCAYFADEQALIIPVCNTWNMRRVKEAISKELKLDKYDHIFDKKPLLRYPHCMLHLFRVADPSLTAEPKRMIVDKTVGRGLEPLKDTSRLLYEKIVDHDTLFCVPLLTIDLSVVCDGEVKPCQMLITLPSTGDQVYDAVCSQLEICFEQTLLLNQYGLLKWNDWAETANLFQDPVVYVVNTVEDVDHGDDWREKRGLTCGLFGGPFSIMVEFSTSKVFRMSVKSFYTVQSVKALVEDYEVISSETQQLMYSGKILEDYRTLNHYKIQHDARLQLELRPRGT